MELEWDTRPLSMAHKSREWHSTQNVAGPSSGTPSSIVSRRRSAAVHAPPPGPPPSQPIPHVPAIPSSPYDTYDGLPNSYSPTFDPPAFASGIETQSQPYSRPTPSSNLAAVAAFSQSRFADPSPSQTASSSTDNLSDPPPRSNLRPTLKPTSPRTDVIVPDRLLLSPPESRSTTSERRPSSRSALTKALELARHAVQLDSTNNDPYGAVQAYGKSVALLSEVMERVMRGEDSTEGKKRNGRRRSVVAQEEEVRRLKSIHDTYADRMNILSLIYSIPLPQHSPPSTYASSVSASTVSTQPSSPSSTSPTSESSLEPRSRTNSTSSQASHDPVRVSAETARLADDPNAALGMESAMFALESSLSHSSFSPRTPIAPTVHPYAASSSQAIPISSPQTVSNIPHRMSVSATTPPRMQIGRPRASSTLPPPAPIPTTLPPPAPTPSILEPLPDISTASHKLLDAATGRSRGQSVSHKRTGSGSRLAALQEESERLDDYSVSHFDTLNGHEIVEEGNRPRSRTVNRESHPLPPLPSPSASSIESATTPRTNVVDGDGSHTPHSPTPFSQRPRGASTLSTRSEMSSSSQTLINNSTTMGTIFQRRNKSSAPPTVSGSGPSSPTESTSSSVPSSSRLTASSLPANTASSLGMTGRSRASSQPGRRPSVVANTQPLTPSTTTQNGTSVRKTSIPSKLNPNAPPQITINTALLSPPLVNSIVPAPLVPPPPIPHANIPTAPMSPLPPTAPTDPLRKPYHMMNLLRQTMTSKTGGYVTRRLHVPQEVWSQGGAKLANIPEKIRVVEVLCSALEELQTWSAEYFGAGNVSIGLVLGIGSIGKKEGDLWSSKLEEFANVCDGVVGNFGKKLGVGEGFVTKKSSGVTSWGGKLSRQIDKFTNGKNLDSPAAYVQGLSNLFMQAQILDEHTKAISSQPMAPLYAAFPIDVRLALEVKLKHASEFFAKVVLTFVVRDMALLLDKYVKKCEKWLAE
ncbi:hypothetical protein C8Q75DRAFT_721701 [Abortiporus biennis]|nr:hypothetical protein C8Q75DRAFT_721701 [Abortiporus biennis]